MGQKNSICVVLAFVLVFAPFILFVSFEPKPVMLTGQFTINVNGPDITVNVTVTNDVANISWQTDVLANSTLNVSGEVEMMGFATYFLVEVEDLTPDTTYDYQILACNNNSDCSLYEDTFTTEPNPADTTAPIIDVNVSVGQYEANISWATDEEANSTLSFNSSLTSYTFATSFSETLTSLSPNTTYSFNITACDASENCGQSSDLFTTEQEASEDTTAPVIDISSSVTQDSATIEWETDELANATFTFNEEEDIFDFDTSFTKTLDNLTTETTYEVTIEACDAYSNCNIESYQFTTSPEEEALAIVSVNISTTENTASLSWHLNKNVTAKLHYANVLILFPLATDFTANLHNLQSNTIYIYNFSACTPENECVSMLSNFTTQLPSDIYEPELVYNISTTNESATLTWTTNEEAMSIVDFLGSAHITDYDTSFSYIFSELDPGTTYSGTITVCDRSNNCNVQAFSFTTREDLDVGGPEIIITVDPGITTATITWSSTQLITSIFSMGEGGTSYGPSNNFERTLTDLTPSTTHHFTITACDLEINCNSQTGSFTTLESPPEVPDTPKVIAIASQEPPSEEPDSEQPVSGQPVPEQPTEIKLFGEGHSQLLYEQPRLVGKVPSVFGKVVRLVVANRLFVSLLLAFLISVLIVNITSIFASREAPICGGSKHTNYLINRANTMIQDKKLREAYELYPSIIRHYKKIKNEKNKERFRDRIRLLYRQLSLFLAMQRVHYTLNHYSKVSEEELKRLHDYLDMVVRETKLLKDQVPYKQYKSLRQHVSREHSKCLEHLYEVRKKLTRSK